jgi:plastocyanin
MPLLGPMIRTRLLQAKTAVAMICGAICLLAPPERAKAATITNYVTAQYWPQYSIAVNVGDTVVWVNQLWTWLVPTNYIESYGGEWKSPPMKQGDSFSFTFTNAGFYAYRTGRSQSIGSWAGTVTVMPWTDAPPAITINVPVDGSYVSDGVLQASVTNTEDITQIEYYDNSQFIGMGTNSPYRVTWWVAFSAWSNGQWVAGQHVFTARATDRQGRVTWSKPVTTTTTPAWGAWGAKLLPTGELLFFYNAQPRSNPGYISASDSPIFTNNACFFYNYLFLGSVSSPGAFVDESVREAAVQRRFYTVIPGMGGACP